MRIQNAIQNTTDQHPHVHQYVVQSLVPVSISRWLVLGQQREKPPPTQLNCRLTSVNQPHTELTASLSSLGKVCWLRLEDGIVRFTIIPDQGTQVWAQLPVVCSQFTSPHPPSQNKTKQNRNLMLHRTPSSRNQPTSSTPTPESSTSKSPSAPSTAPSAPPLARPPPKSGSRKRAMSRCSR